MSTRRQGRGSMLQRGPDTWLLRVDDGFKPNGKRKQSTRTVHGTKEDADKALTAFLSEVDRGVLADGDNLTLATYLREKWMPHVRTRVRASTWERYQQLAETHIIPAIGRVKLGKLKPVHCQQVVDAMVAKKLSGSTTLQAFRGVLAQSLRQAVSWQLLAVNPAAGIRPPRAERPTLQVPDETTCQAILEAARGTLLEGPVTLAMATGMRLGEVLGLRWRDVDLDKGLVRVTAAITWSGPDFDFVQPKTPRARRTVALPPFAVDWLRRHRTDQLERRLLVGEGWRDHDIVLDRGDGRPLRIDTVSGGFRQLAKTSGFAGTRFHDLRHAYATTLLKAGVHPKVASEALGHASVAFTLDTYSHVVPSMQEQSATAIQAALGGEAT